MRFIFFFLKTSTDLDFIAVHLLRQCEQSVGLNGTPVPSVLQAVVYEEPGFEGSFLEIDSDVFSFREGEGDPSANLDSKKLKAVGSLKVVGGL